MAKKVRPKMNTYAILSRAVEESVPYGLRRIFKYASPPRLSEDEVVAAAETVVNAVMNELCEVIKFDDDPEP